MSDQVVNKIKSAEAIGERRGCFRALCLIPAVERHLKRGDTLAAMKSLQRMKRYMERKQAEAERDCKRHGFDPWAKSEGRT